MDMMIVRRGLSERYYFFLKLFAAGRGLQVIQDRRCQERRRASQHASDERRRQEQRGSLANTWELADFVVLRRPKSEEDDSSAPSTTEA
jgi:hypothetical protein